MSLQLELIQTQSKKETAIMFVLSIVFAISGIAIFIIGLSLSGHEFKTSDIYQFTVEDTFSNSLNFSRVIFWAMPLVLTGLSVAVAFKAGLFNIGGQGQMMVGAGFAAIWGAYIVPESEFWSRFNNPLFMVTTTVLAGLLGGGIWGMVPGILKAYTGAHEVITTILMNLTAVALINYWFVSQTYSPFVDKSSVDAYGQSDSIIPNARIPSLNGNPTIKRILDFFHWEITTELNFGILLVILAVVVTHIIVFKSNFGFKLRAVGLNPTAAETAGINSKRVTVIAMTMSGALSGLAGAILVAGVPTYRYITSFESTYGFDGIAVALIGANSPFAIAIAAVLFGFLREAGLNLERNTDLPSDLILIFQGFVILFTAAPLIAKKLMTFTEKQVTTVIHQVQHDNEEPAKEEEEL